MPLIPADVGLRLRLDNELQAQPVAPLKEIAADLPRLQAGQPFTAQIRDVLPQNTYLALVGGKQITLSLPGNVKSGDVLELVVVEQTPKAVIAAFADPAGATGKGGTPNTTLSTTGQMLRSILVDEGETPSAAPLNRGQPLLTQPPQNGADLAPALQKAVTQSGLFYEAHQAQWVSGQRPLSNLRQEPQGQIPVSPQPPQPSPSTAPGTTGAPFPLGTTQTPPPTLFTATPGALLPGTSTAAAPGQQTSPTVSASPTAALPQTANPPPSPAAPPVNNGVLQSLLLYQSNQAQSPHPPSPMHPPAPALVEANENNAAQALATANAHPAAHTTPSPSATDKTATSTPAGTPYSADEATRNAAAATAPSATQAKPMPTLPDELRALVQQQLDAAGTQRLLWHGEVWPGQSMHWQLEWQDARGQANAEEAEPWQTTLRLSTPRLGTLEAALSLGPAGVRMALSTAASDSAATLRAHVAELESALAAAGVPLRGFSARHSPAEPPEAES